MVLSALVIAQQGDKPKDEPKFSGRPFSFWLGELKNANPLFRQEALAVLEDAGMNAKEVLPIVEKMLADDSPAVRNQAAFTVWRLGGPTKAAAEAVNVELQSKDGTRRNRALFLMTQLGADAAPAVPGLLLIQTDADPFLHNRVQNTLQSVGVNLVPALTEALEHKDPVVRYRAAFQLANRRDAQRTAAASLTKRLTDEDRRVRFHSAWALWQFGERGQVGKVLAENLLAAEPALRPQVLLILLDMEPKPRSIAAVCRSALSERDNLMRAKAASALWEIEKKADEVLPVLIAVLNDRSVPGDTWRYAVPVLGRMGADAKTAVPVLLDLLKSSDGGTHVEIALALTAIGAPAVNPLLDALAQLEEKLRPAVRPGSPVQQGNPHIHEMIAQVLGLIGKPTVEPVMERIASKDPRVRAAAARALAACGSVAKPAVEKVIERLKDEDATVRRWSAEAIGSIGANAGESLASLLDDREESVRTAAASALCRIECDGAIRKTAAEKALKDDSSAVRIRGVELLWKADPQNREVVAKVREMLAKEETRKAVLELLPRMKEVAKELVPVLTELFKEKSVALKTEACAVLAGLGPAAKSAVPALLDLLKETTFPSLKQSILEALHAIGVEDTKTIALLVDQFRTRDVANPSPALFELLSRFKGDARGAMPQLGSIAVVSQNLRERILAARAMMEIDPDNARKEMSSLERALGVNYTAVRAAVTILQIDKGNKEAIEVLLRRATDEKHPDHGLALHALGLLGADMKELAGPVLKKMIDGPGKNSALGFAYWRITGESEKAVSMLLEELVDGRLAVRGGAAQMLGEMGTAAKPAVPALLLMRLSSDPLQNGAAQSAFSRILRAGN
jgi:HEAT repeat protein